MNAVVPGRKMRNTFVLLAALAVAVSIGLALGFMPQQSQSAVTADPPYAPESSSQSVGISAAEAEATRQITPTPMMPGYEDDYYDEDDQTRAVEIGGALLMFIGFAGVGFGVARGAKESHTGNALAIAGGIMGLVGVVMLTDDGDHGAAIAAWLLVAGVAATIALFVHSSIFDTKESRSWRLVTSASLWASVSLFQVLAAVWFIGNIWPQYA
jgi:hypothetical protein